MKQTKVKDFISKETIKILEIINKKLSEIIKTLPAKKEELSLKLLSKTIDYMGKYENKDNVEQYNALRNIKLMTDVLNAIN